MKRAAGDVPIFIGSGITADTIKHFDTADGFIVGTALKKDGIATHPVDLARVKSIMNAI